MLFGLIVLLFAVQINCQPPLLPESIRYTLTVVYKHTQVSSSLNVGRAVDTNNNTRIQKRLIDGTEKIVVFSEQSQIAHVVTVPRVGPVECADVPATLVQHLPASGSLTAVLPRNAPLPSYTGTVIVGGIRTRQYSQAFVNVSTTGHFDRLPQDSFNPWLHGPVLGGAAATAPRASFILKSHYSDPDVWTPASVPVMVSLAGEQEDGTPFEIEYHLADVALGLPPAYRLAQDYADCSAYRPTPTNPPSLLSTTASSTDTRPTTEPLDMGTVTFAPAPTATPAPTVCIPVVCNDSNDDNNEGDTMTDGENGDSGVGGVAAGGVRMDCSGATVGGALVGAVIMVIVVVTLGAVGVVYRRDNIAMV